MRPAGVEAVEATASSGQTRREREACLAELGTDGVIDRAGVATEMLREAATALGDGSGQRLEFSVRLGPGTVSGRGRLSVWQDAGVPGAGQRVRTLLRQLGAPAEALEVAGASDVVTHGIAVAAGAFRYYALVPDARGGHDHYRAWRWRGAASATRRYVFHFLPETPAGERPADLVPPALSAAFDALCRLPRARASSGFWLRRDEAGRVDQVDVALPWNPLLGPLLDRIGLVRAFDLAEDAVTPWRSLPIRHLAAAPDGRVTAYASTDRTLAWPADEGDLQAAVRAGAERARRALDPHFADLDTGSGGHLGGSGSDDLAPWRAVLGAELHCHPGIFAAPLTHLPSDAEMEAALLRAVRTLYPLIPAGSTVYDLGCGWGGPLRMLARDHGCRMLGLTADRDQYRHVAGMGLPVRWGDPDTTLPPGRFDCVLMLDTFGRVADKPRLLRTLRRASDRLVMRVSCRVSTSVERMPAPDRGAPEPHALADMLASAGWRIVHWRDRRPESLASVSVWHRRFASVAPTDDARFERFRRWCARTAPALAAWGRHNPLIEVAAVPADLAR